MKKALFILFTALLACDTGNLIVIADLPEVLSEVSGTETIKDSNIIWMINDSGNTPKLFGLNKKGKLVKELVINAKNKDWEDLTSDKEGHLYIGDFGNNQNKRKGLAVLKINAEDLKKEGPISISRISFKYDNQNNFPPKKKKMYFDCEAFFHFNDSLYLFTKSRVKNDFGKTNLYKIPSKPGDYNAEFISSFKTGDKSSNWITSADISDDGKRVVILSPKAAWVFTNFTGNDFFNGDSQQFLFDYNSQKESVCFKSNNELYISDEKVHGAGGNLYEFKLQN